MGKDDLRDSPGRDAVLGCLKSLIENKTIYNTFW
jgi:hypothetical protein